MIESSEDRRTSISTFEETKGNERLPLKTHLPGLDGVRAIAILLVVVHHALYMVPGADLAQNIVLHIAGQGWVGVDLFFVLSGFLITGILLDVRERKHALRNFYLRRAVRIVPVYVAFLLFSLHIASRIGILTPAEAAQLHETQGWFWTYSVNLLVALRSWGAASFPTVHLWSLAVEEQFYLLWPAVVLFVSPVAVRRTALVCIVAAELFRLAFIVAGAGGQVNYVMLPSRMDSLAAGAFLACAYRDQYLWARVMRCRRPIAIVSSAIIVAIVLYRHTINNQAALEQLFAFPCLVALASIVVASAVRHEGVLANRILGFIGKISYAMYVWHLEVLRVIRRIFPPPQDPTARAFWIYYVILVVGTLGGTIIVSIGSWYVIEQPFLRFKRRVPVN